MKALGQYIREQRTERDISLREFANRVDCSAPFISDVELGRRYPSEKVLARIAQILQLDIESLRQHDTRPPIEEIKRITEDDPRYAMAFRTVIDRKIDPDELMKLGKPSPRSSKSTKNKK